MTFSGDDEIFCFTWEKQWIWKFQSVWCTIERFKYANSFNNNDMKKVLHAKAYRIPIVDPLNVYISSNSINYDRFTEIFHENIMLSNQIALINSIAPIIDDNNLNILLSKTWRYCPLCIKEGYHSILHQLIIFDNCPFHNIPLKTRCPNCNLEHKYVVNLSENRNGFQCECGYYYLDNDNYGMNFKLWTESNLIKIINNKVIMYNCNYIYLYPSFQWFIAVTYNTDIPRNSYEIFGKLLFEKFSQIKFSNVTFKYLQTNTTIPDYKDPIYDSSRFILMDEYLAILKSISRYIRKKYNTSNKLKFFTSSNLFLHNNSYSDTVSIQNLNYKDISTELYAYILWKKIIEGHETISTIQVRLNSLRSDDSQYGLKKIIANTIYYRYIENNLKSYFSTLYNNTNKGIKYNWGILVSSFEHIAAYLILECYYECLKYAKHQKSLYPNNRINFNNVYIFPKIDFIIKVNNSNTSTLIKYPI